MDERRDGPRWLCDDDDDYSDTLQAGVKPPFRYTTGRRPLSFVPVSHAHFRGDIGIDPS